MTFLLGLFWGTEFSHAKFGAQLGRLTGTRSPGGLYFEGDVVRCPGKCAFGWHGKKGIQNFLKLTPLRSWPRPWEFPNISLVLIEVAVSWRLA